jgi:phosphoribosylpyrophosphate synthetase
MKNMTKIILMLVAGLMLAQCSTYKIKQDMNKSGVVNKTPKWYVEYNHETMFKWQEAATAVSPDMELAVKKATLLAKAKLVDRINGEMNNRTTITKNEAGTNEDLNVEAGSQDVIVNVIEDTLARGYEVTKQEMFLTKTKSYRVYVMIEVSKKEVEEIINQVNKRRLALIDSDSISKQAEKILN